MRDVKFRAWDSEKKQMARVSMLGEEEAHLYKVTGETWVSPKHYVAVIMQYTGLKDSDEKEIYEGDILSFTTEIYYDGVYLETDHIEKVEFDEGSYWAHGHWLTEIIANDYGVKVIGNIYENPELLEDDAE